MLTNETLSEWRQNPTTREVFKYLQKNIQTLEQKLGQGGTLNRSSAIETLANTAYETGLIEGIKVMLEFTISKDDEE
jgi:hypothetical protein